VSFSALADDVVSAMPAMAVRANFAMIFILASRD
jgi:hypothetical protein